MRREDFLETDGVLEAALDEAKAVTRPREDVVSGGGATGPGKPSNVNRVFGPMSAFARKN